MNRIRVDELLTPFRIDVSPWDLPTRPAWLWLSEDVEPAQIDPVEVTPYFADEVTL